MRPRLSDVQAESPVDKLQAILHIAQLLNAERDLAILLVVGQFDS